MWKVFVIEQFVCYNPNMQYFIKELQIYFFPVYNLLTKTSSHIWIVNLESCKKLYHA